MKGYSMHEVGPDLYQLATPIRSILLDGNEINTILDYFREREWEAEIRDAIDQHPEFELEDVEEFVTEVLDEIKGTYEIYGEYHGNIESLVIDMYEEE